MRWKHATSYLPLAVAGLILLGCDPIAPSSYRGESRLNLTVGVVNSLSEKAEKIVPALAHVSESQVVFREVVATRAEFVTEFRLDLYDSPPNDRLTPLDPLRAPDVIIAREHLGVVLKSRLGEPIRLTQRVVDLHPHCWNGACDYLPGAMTKPCEEGDEVCLERQRQCQGGMCQLVESGAVRPEGVEDVVGFDPDHMVLFAAQSIPAGSWAARKLWAPDGLAAGYHLAKDVEPSDEARHEEDECLRRIEEDVIERFNEERGNAYTTFELRCLEGTSFSANNCEGVELPTGAAREALAAALTDAEIESGCLELAPRLEFIEEPENTPIEVRIDGEVPHWFPSVPPAASPLDEARCEGALDVLGNPAVEFQLVGFSGSLCPEELSVFSSSDGVFGLSSSVENQREQHCELNVVMKVPPGYRFRKPIFMFQGFYWRESEMVVPSFVTMTYSMGGSEPMISNHVVSGPLEGDFFTLLDTPEIGLMECTGECEPVELDLKIEARLQSPEGASISLISIDAQHHLGVEWTTCDEPFVDR